MPDIEIEIPVRTGRPRPNRYDPHGRYRAYVVDEQAIMQMLGNWRHSDAISLPEVELPEGFEIHGVEHTYRHRCFLVLVWHPSFAPVPVHTEPPVVGALALKQFAVRIPADLQHRADKEASNGPA